MVPLASLQFSQVYWNIYLKIHLLCFCPHHSNYHCQCWVERGCRLEDPGDAVSLVGIPLPFQGMFRTSASQRQSYSWRVSQLWLFVRTFWKVYELQHGWVGPIPQRFRLKSSPKMATASVCSKSSLGDSTGEPGGRTLRGEVVTSQALLGCGDSWGESRAGPTCTRGHRHGDSVSCLQTFVGFLSHGAKE